ncbi:MAG: O-antigen ligase family protein, partial [Chloroflexota bacterium]
SFAPVPLLMMQARAKAGWYVGAAAGLAAILVLSISAEPLWFDRFTSWTSLTSIETEQSQRLDLWQTAVRMTIDHPVLGVGLRMFEENSHQYLQRDWAAEGRPSFYAHQVLLHYASAGGLGALAAVLGLHIVALWTAWTIRRKQADPQLRALALGLSWALTSMVISGLIGGAGFAVNSPPGSPMGTLDPGFWFWTVLGLVFAIAALRPEDERVGG